MSATCGHVLVLCGAPTCAGEVHAQALEALAEVVRTSSHGMLVRGGCTSGPVACRLRPAGPMLVVQACDARLHATAPALRVGPLRGRADVDAVAAWLRDGADPARLPGHLVATHRTMSAAAQN